MSKKELSFLGVPIKVETKLGFLLKRIQPWKYNRTEIKGLLVKK